MESQDGSYFSDEKSEKNERYEIPEVLEGLRPEVLVNQATLGNQYPPAKKKTQWRYMSTYNAAIYSSSNKPTAVLSKNLFPLISFLKQMTKYFTEEIHSLLFNAHSLALKLISQYLTIYAQVNICNNTE